MSSPIKDATEGLKRSMTLAMADSFRSLGMSGDKQVRVYSRLKQKDFETLSKQFGEEAISKYIREMELRRASHG